MIERFLKQTTFHSRAEFTEKLEFIVPDHFNFAYDVMDAWADEAPEKQALLWTNDLGEVRSYSFGDLRRETDRSASFLQSIGIGKGDKVMLTLKRRVEFWFAILALHKIGAVAVPATHMLTTQDYVYRNQSADIKAIICVGEDYVIEQVTAALPESPSLKHCISVGPAEFTRQTDTPGDVTLHLWHKEITQAPTFVRPKNVNNNDDTMILYFTSGTSGKPKMVAHNYLYALGHLVTGVYWHNLTPDSVHLTVADTGWGKAVWGKLYGQWFAGATVFVYDHDKFAAADLLEKMATHKVTSFCAPPTVYRFMIHEDFSRYDLSALRYCTTAGEALNPAVFDKFKALTGIELREGFGQTETTMTLGILPWDKPKPGSMGLPNPQYKIDLLRPDGTSCEDGEKGEIVIQTKDAKPLGLFQGYYQNDPLTHEAWHDHNYHTGDLAWRDEDGYYWFVGRADDVIKSSGYRIGPFEVESALMTHPAVVECAVTGVPDPDRGQIVKASIVLHPNYIHLAGAALIKELQMHVKQSTAPYKYPRVIEFVDALPKTISGKIRRVELREESKKEKKERNNHHYHK